MLKLFDIKLTSSEKLPSSSLIISNELRQTTKLQPGQKLDLQFGNRLCTVTFIGYYDCGAETTVCIAENVRYQLLLPTPVQLNLIIEHQTHEWRLGPLIGIFGNRTGRIEKPFGEQTGFFSKLRAAASSLNSFCFAFGPGDIDWNNRIIHGTVPPLLGDSPPCWQTLILPFPDVIYDRGLFQKGEKRSKATETRKILRKFPGVSFFNPAFFGKWKTHKLLSNNESLSNYLPETRLYCSPSDITDLLNKHETIYLKPSGGSSGRGIIRVTRVERGFLLNNRVLKQVTTLEFDDLNQLSNYFEQKIGNTRYIVQQGLRLATLNGSPFDIRVLMQKDWQDIWHRTGIAVRVAGPGNYLSNLHAGGHAAKISSVLTTVFPQQTEEILNEIRRLTALIASWVSSEGHPLFGEIAIDLGIDNTGRVWIIELNAIPGRSVFRRIGAPDILSRAISRPIEYAYFLSGFAPSSDKCLETQINPVYFDNTK